MREYLKRELLHSAIAIGLTVAVAVGADLAKAEHFDSVFLSGLAITTVRSVGTGLVFIGTRYITERQRAGQ